MKLTEEQVMLLDTAASFCRDKSPVDAVRQAIADDHVLDSALWQEIAELGWLSVAVDEEYGGLGLGVGSLVPIVESMGRHLMGTPYLATSLAIAAIQANGSDTQKRDLLPGLAAGSIATVALTEEDGSWQLGELSAEGTLNNGELSLCGNKMLVLDAASAELIVTSVRFAGEPRLVAIRKDQLADDAIQREVVIDETRRSYSVSLDGAVVSEEQVLPGKDLKYVELAAMLLLTAEASGGLSATLATIVEYLNTRKQFEQYIGSYQALKHPTVDILLAEEACKSYVYHAASLFDGGDREALETAVRMAKAQSSEAFAYAGDRAVQFHGGFGFTYECDAQLYLRRALWVQHMFGDERHQRAILAPRLLDDVG